MNILKEIESPDDSKIINAYNKEREINNYRNKLRDANIYNINNKEYGYQEGYDYDEITDNEIAIFL